MELKCLIVPYNFIKNPPSKAKIDNKATRIQNGEIIKVTIDKYNNIINGYASYLAYMKLGCKECACVVLENEISKHFNLSKRLLIYNEAEGRCYICGRKCNKFGETVKNDFEHDNLNATLDHVIPLHKGGTNDYNNLKLCCRICNNLKSDFTYSEELVTVIKKELQERNLI